MGDKRFVISEARSRADVSGPGVWEAFLGFYKYDDNDPAKYLLFSDANEWFEDLYDELQELRPFRNEIRYSEPNKGGFWYLDEQHIALIVLILPRYIDEYGWAG